MLTREIKIEGIELRIAPTPLALLADVEKHLAAKTTNTAEGRAALVRAIFFGIRRTKKECPKSGGITEEWLQENVDVHNGLELFDLFFDLNGFRRKKPNGEGVTEGEAAAGAAAPAS